MAYGAEVDGHTLDELIARFTTPGGVDEAALYTAAGFARLAAGADPHGTHVLDLSAGWPDPLRDAPQSPTLREASGNASVVFVQVPEAAIEDLSGAWLTVYVLDGVRYIVDKAGPGRRVVVNISLGAFAGPHDGTSLLEAALDDLLERHPNLAIVLAAGNARGQGTHAELTLEPGEQARVRWVAPVGDVTETFVELWVDGEEAQRPGVVLAIEPPVVPAVALGPAQCGQALVWRQPDEGGKALCAVVSTPASGRSGQRLMLVALAPTDGQGTRAPAPSGAWCAVLHNTGRLPAVVRAWIERDDPTPGRNGSLRQAAFIDAVTDANTLSSLAMGRRTIVVGSYVLDTGHAAKDSSLGPESSEKDQRAGPDVMAPGLAHRDRGILAAGGRTLVPARKGGTSMAAAVATRHVVNALPRAGSSMSREALVAALLQPSHQRDGSLRSNLIRPPSTAT